jgi:hypothetical protein
MPIGPILDAILIRERFKAGFSCDERFAGRKNKPRMELF